MRVATVANVHHTTALHTGNTMHDDERPSPEDTPDTEGHAFKWTLEDDGKGGKRPRQGWDPDSSPPGRPVAS